MILVRESNLNAVLSQTAKTVNSLHTFCHIFYFNILKGKFAEQLVHSVKSLDFEKYVLTISNKVRSIPSTCYKFIQLS